MIAVMFISSLVPSNIEFIITIEIFKKFAHTIIKDTSIQWNNYCNWSHVVLRSRFVISAFLFADIIPLTHPIFYRHSEKHRIERSTYSERIYPLVFSFISADFFS